MLIVTTTIGLWILDLETGLAWLIDRSHGVYYGISFTQDQCFVAARNAPYGSDRETQDNLILCFDRRLALAQALRAPQRIRDAHQILAKDGVLYVVATWDDAVLTCDLKTMTWDRWYPLGHQTPDDRNRHHLNSIQILERDILLVGNKPYGWYAVFDRATRIVVEGPAPLGAGTHNVWRETGGAVAVCSSSQGALLQASGGLTQVHERGWLRGIAIAEGRRYVGVCQNLVRDIRGGSDATVAALSATGRIERCYSFHGFGMIHDLRAAEADPVTHNGESFRLDRSAFNAADAYRTGERLVELEPAAFAAGTAAPGAA